MDFKNYYNHAIKESSRSQYWLKHPKEMTKDEFFNPPEISPDPGHRILYHATENNDTARKIFREGLLLSEMKGHISKEPDVIWATTRPNAYSEVKPLVIFQVPENDPSVNYVGTNQARVLRDVPPEDIIALDPVYTILDTNRLSKFQKKYTDMYWDKLQSDKKE